jgi:nucleotide-binding universal stress UspA family protein
VHETTIPLCVVRRPAQTTLRRRILVPIVDDDLARLGVSYAVRMAQYFRSMLLFCSFEDAAGERPAAQALSRAKEAAAAGGVAAEVLILPKDDGISDAIVRNADVHACDWIVMATHGRRGLPLLIEGSVTEAVIYASDVPVVIVRAPP